MKNPPVYQQAKYLKSAPKLEHLPADSGAEVAFIGRSNAGKSSALNVITGIKGLARTSKTPGRTQMINFFELDAHRRLVDLPGYGYAKVPRLVRERWQQTTNEYLQTRQSLRGLVVVMDMRHPLKESDQEIIAWAASCGVALHIVLKKTDKVKPAAARKALKEVQLALVQYGDLISIQLFSSLSRLGLDDMRSVLNDWFCESETSL